jgi:hypothetical protein
MYITHGPVGEKLYAVGQEWWTDVAIENVSMYVLYSVEGSQIKGTAKALDGSILDEFVLEHPSF